MSKQMTGFKLFFRNGETWTINREHIGDLWIKKVTTSYGRINGGDFEKIRPCESFKIEIFEEADRVNTDDINQGGLETGMFGRAIKYQDIEKMTIRFDNNKEEMIYFPYKDKGTPGQEGLDNSYQSTVKSDSNKLYIVIDPDFTVEDIYADKL